MKKIIFTFCLLMAAMFLTAQDVPQAINFQAIARDANSEVMANTPIMIQLTILDGEPDGAQVYREIRSLTTNNYGSFSFQIGRDPYMSDGNFADIDWAGSRKFLKIDYDPTASLSFDLSLGTIEFVSVPYAFAAGSVSYIDATGANDGDVLAYNATTGRFEPVAMSIPDFEESDPTVPDWAKANAKPVYNYSEIEGTPEIPTVPTNVSAFTNDANYLTSYTETDPTVPAWAKAETKPTYSYEEITGKPELFSGNYNDLTNKPTIPTVPTNVSEFTNDANYLTSYTEADPTVPTWAKTETKPSYSYEEITGKPTNVSAFTNDANYLTSYTEADPTVPTWAKTETKPTYSYEEITGKPTNVSAFTNDANYLTTEGDPTVPDWAKAANKPTYTYEEIENTPDLFDGNYNSLTNRPELFDGNYNNLTNTPDLSGYLTSYTESQTLADAAALGNSVNTQLKNVSDPTDAQDAVTKAYVDALIAQLQAAIDALNTTGTLNGHEWVDLGLPSGTRWATCNVGANTPEAYGDYFAWGETTPKETYNWSTYRYYDGSNVTKYTGSDNLAILEASDDAATANWGSGWRMPTKEDFEELQSNCTVTWTTQNGVNGRLFTGPNGNSIFLPAAGYRYDSSLNIAGSYGYYWSSSLNTGGPSGAWNLGFGSDYYGMNNVSRYYGQSVRPVCVSQN